ncbi:glycosyltransferase [Roseomonas sp. JC162]|uniref:Glycosyltransferase n=1 Tax=Neoroseomonas marina TaxID=1232220 RepID=A0A848EHE9_9PROT|nr:glycosyltransferase family 2 protein [Neoroseomonas marina]NMJ42853.1 glycosyltransferase [Neoroseomonas marina]
MTAPRFTIVTPCLNRAATIGAAIESVLAQNHPSVEHIIVDGGSTDGTAEVLARYPHLTVVREKDRNLYDAINKGLRRATGDIVGLLNSDDLYAPGAFAAAEVALADPSIQMVIGAAEFFTERDGREVVTRHLSGAAAVGLTEANAIGNVTTMNAAFYRRPLIEAVKGFDDRFPLAADKDFWLRLVLLAPRHVIIPDTVIRYRSHAGSLTFAAGDLRDKLSRHLLELARTRLAETPPASAERAAYRRWHAWAVGYRAMVQARASGIGTALRTMAAGFALDPAWPLRFLAQLPRHWRDRAVRREG